MTAVSEKIRRRVQLAIDQVGESKMPKLLELNQGGSAEIFGSAGIPCKLPNREMYSLVMITGETDEQRTFP